MISPGEPPAGAALHAFNAAFTASKLSPRAQQPYSVNNFDAAMLCILSSEAAHSSSGSAMAAKMLSVVSRANARSTFRTLTRRSPR